MSHSEQKRAHSETGARQRRIDETLRLVHHHAGYMRIRSGAFVQPEDGDPRVSGARTAAEGVSGFRSWVLNPKTGSVVVEYDPDMVEADDLLNHIARSAGLAVGQGSDSGKMNRQELVSGFLDTVQGVNQIASQLTGERADLREIVPVALAAISVVSLVLNEDRGILPFWSSALYHSYRVFMHWHRPEVRTRERAARQEEESRGSGNMSGN